MSTASEGGVSARVGTGAEHSAFLATLASKIQHRRAELGEGQWLSEELRIALEEMAPILQLAKVTFEVVRGVKSTILIKPIRSGRVDPNEYIEAYSIKMMSSCLKNPRNQFLSHTLDAGCREARQQLIDILREVYHRLVGPDQHEGANSQRGPRGSTSSRTNDFAVAAEKTAWLVALRERKQQEQRKNLLDSVLKMPTVVIFRRDNEKAFQRIFDAVWKEVKSGSVPESIAAGKILDHVYSSRALKPVSKLPTGVVPSSDAVEIERSFHRASQDGREPARREVQKAATDSSQTAKPVQLPAILDNWVGQGLTAHRIFRDLQKMSDLESQVMRWTRLATEARTDVEYLVILRILGSVTRFSADDEIVQVAVPLMPQMGFAEFEGLIAQGKAGGVYGVDPRIWGVIEGVYSFVIGWLGPQLGRRR